MEEIEIGKSYILFDILPSIYNKVFYASLNYIRDEDIVKERLSNLYVKFLEGNVFDSDYDHDDNIVIVFIPFSLKFNVEDNKVNFNDLNNYLYNNALPYDALSHEIFHHMQNIQKKELEYYENRIKDKTIKHDEVPYEKDAIVKAIFQLKKQNFTYDDLERQVWLRFFKANTDKYSISKDLQKINIFKTTLNDPNESLKDKNYAKESLNISRNNVIKVLSHFYKGDEELTFENMMDWLKKETDAMVKKDKEDYGYLYRFKEYWDKDKKEWKVNNVNIEKLYHIIYKLICVSDNLDKQIMIKHANLVDGIISNLCEGEYYD